VRGDSTRIRACATKYASLPPTVARLVPQLIIWAIQCASLVRRDHLAAAAYPAANDAVRSAVVVDMAHVARDLMMYSGFLKYRLPASVNDALARIAAE
jgi:hypothetical protein